MTVDPGPDRILLLRTAPDTLVAVRATSPDGHSGRETEWRALPLAIAEQLVGHLSSAAGAPDGAVGRVFEMHPDDLAAWDAVGHDLKDGWTYAYGRATNGRFSGTARLEEVAPPDAAAPVPDPVTLATAVAVAQLQAQVEALTRIVEQTHALSSAILGDARYKQEARILAIAEDTHTAHRRLQVTGTVDSIDWQSLAPLGTDLRAQHRQLLAELRDVHTRATYTSPAGAQAFLDDPRADPNRVGDVLALLWHNVRTLHQWTALQVAVKGATRTLDPAEVTDTLAATEQYLTEVRAAARELASIETSMPRTPWYAAIWPRGIVGQRIHENDLQVRATDRRAQVTALAGAHKDAALPPGATPVRLVTGTDHT